MSVIIKEDIFNCFETEEQAIKMAEKLKQLSQSKNLDKNLCNLVIDSILEIIDQPKKIIQKFHALRLLSESSKLSIGEIINGINKSKKLLDRLEQLALVDKDLNEQYRGQHLFDRQADPKYQKLFYQLNLECLSFWGTKHRVAQNNKLTNFGEKLFNLNEKGVQTLTQFPIMNKMSSQIQSPQIPQQQQLQKQQSEMDQSEANNLYQEIFSEVTGLVQEVEQNIKDNEEPNEFTETILGQNKDQAKQLKRKLDDLMAKGKVHLKQGQLNQVTGFDSFLTTLIQNLTDAEKEAFEENAYKIFRYNVMVATNKYTGVRVPPKPPGLGGPEVKNPDKQQTVKQEPAKLEPVKQQETIKQQKPYEQDYEQQRYEQPRQEQYQNRQDPTQSRQNVQRQEPKQDQRQKVQDSRYTPTQAPNSAYQPKLTSSVNNLTYQPPPQQKYQQPPPQQKQILQSKPQQNQNVQQSRYLQPPQNQQQNLKNSRGIIRSENKTNNRQKNPQFEVRVEDDQDNISRSTQNEGLYYPMMNKEFNVQAYQGQFIPFDENPFHAFHQIFIEERKMRRIKNGNLRRMAAIIETNVIQIGFNSNLIYHEIFNKYFLRIELAFGNKTESLFHNFNVAYYGDTSVGIWCKDPTFTKSVKNQRGEEGYYIEEHQQMLQQLCINYNRIPYETISGKVTFQDDFNKYEVEFIVPCLLTQFFHLRDIDEQTFINKWNFKEKYIMKSEVVEINSKILRDHSTINNYFPGILDLTQDQNVYEYGMQFTLNSPNIEYMLKVIIFANKTILFQIIPYQSYLTQAEHILHTLVFLFGQI
ncbi:hypothetical protein pb186bvf_012146 [Paramecium bursaria]